mgnify:CR=1 FL=1
MYKKFVLLALAVPFFLTGCWDKKDPEDRAFIITLGVDTAAENGCHFTFAPANIETGEAEIYAAESETLSGAVAQVDTYTSPAKQAMLLRLIIGYYEKSLDALSKDASFNKLAALPVREDIGRFKYTEEDKCAERYEEITAKLNAEIRELTEGGEA